MKGDVYEIINGEKFKFTSENLITNQIKGRLLSSIGNYLVRKEIGYLFLNVRVHFSEENSFIPDLSVVLKSNEKILANRKNICGAPDMVVEVLSHSTRKKDLTIKKDTYEAQGVKEYWIVDPWGKSVYVYLLREGKYSLDDRYILLEGEDFDSLTDEEKADFKTEVPVSILEGLNVPLKFIFDWGY